VPLHIAGGCTGENNGTQVWKPRHTISVELHALSICIKVRMTAVFLFVLNVVFHVKVVLVLCQGYVSEKHATRTQNSHLKQCISCGLRD
jgi:uncharacterized sodium:solute symporter family permease YidK